MALKLPAAKVAPVPVIANGRSAEPNPFDPIVKELNEKRDTSRVFPFPYKSDEDKKQVAAVKNAAQRAGRSAGVSVRVKIDTDEKAGTATVTVWVVDKITRNRAATTLAEEIDPTPSKNTGK